MVSPRNKTITLNEDEIARYSQELSTKVGENKLVNTNFFSCELPENFVDLLILDPPNNLIKNYDGKIHKRRDPGLHASYFREVIEKVRPTLKKSATVYVCSDWSTSLIVAPILEDYFLIRNRVTWSRRKGRGSKTNWKSNSEDIWFCTGDEYYFNADAVQIKKKIIAPYREKGRPKDWIEKDGKKYRLTAPSNFWADITVPFWSMAENTEHPTQKPEKLLAKLILASSKEGDVVFDPFAGSGSTLVAANKLNRKWCGIEISKRYCCTALKRLERGGKISGYDGAFDYCKDEYA